MSFAPDHQDVLDACEAVDVACAKILTRSVIWLALHPLTTWRLRSDMRRKRDHMRALMDAWTASGRPIRGEATPLP